MVRLLRVLRVFFALLLLIFVCIAAELAIDYFSVWQDDPYVEGADRKSSCSMYDNSQGNWVLVTCSTNLLGMNNRHGAAFYLYEIDTGQFRQVAHIFSRHEKRYGAAALYNQYILITHRGIWQEGVDYLLYDMISRNWISISKGDYNTCFYGEKVLVLNDALDETDSFQICQGNLTDGKPNTLLIDHVDFMCLSDGIMYYKNHLEDTIISKNLSTGKTEIFQSPEVTFMGPEWYSVVAVDEKRIAISCPDGLYISSKDSTVRLLEPNNDEFCFVIKKCLNGTLFCTDARGESVYTIDVQSGKLEKIISCATNNIRFCQDYIVTVKETWKLFAGDIILTIWDYDGEVIKELSLLHNKRDE